MFLYRPFYKMSMIRFTKASIAFHLLIFKYFCSTVLLIKKEEFGHLQIIWYISNSFICMYNRILFCK